MIRQTDISGYCPTTYTVSEQGEALLITKQKDLLTCSGRGHLVSSLQSTPYKSSAHIQSLPLLKSVLRITISDTLTGHVDFLC